MCIVQLENVLLDERGHCKISDLGLAVVTKVKIKGYAGTPGYDTASSTTQQHNRVDTPLLLFKSNCNCVWDGF